MREQCVALKNHPHIPFMYRKLGYVTLAKLAAWDAAVQRS